MYFLKGSGTVVGHLDGSLHIGGRAVDADPADKIVATLVGGRPPVVRTGCTWWVGISRYKKMKVGPGLLGYKDIYPNI